MLKPTPLVCVAALLALALYAMATAPSQQPPPHISTKPAQERQAAQGVGEITAPHSITEQNKPSGGGKSQGHNTFTEHPAEWSIALFTFMLWLATTALVRDARETGAKQVEAMAKSASAAETSAKALRRTFRLGRDTDRAYLAIGPTEIFIQPGDPLDPRKHNKVRLSLTVHNVGRTAAFITTIYGEFSRDLPKGDEPVYTDGFRHPTDIAIAGGADSLLPVVYEDDYTGPQHFWGYVEFTDIFRRPHTARYCTRIFPRAEDVGLYEIAGSPAWSAWD